MLSPTAGTLGRTFHGKGRLGWGGDKKGGIGVGEGDLGDVVPSVEPVRSHAGVNVAGPPTCKSNAGGRRKKVKERGDIGGGGFCLSPCSLILIILIATLVLSYTVYCINSCD